jgi:pyruvate formate lyase activating enzyme
MPRGEDGRIEGSEVSPSKIVSLTKQYRCQSISYTYTEPTIYFEYAFEIARQAHQGGIKNIFVTNGYMTEEALKTIPTLFRCSQCGFEEYQGKIL